MFSARTGKEKSALVPLSYARGRPRRVLIALSVGLVALLGIGAYLWAGRWEQLASPGAVHSAHAAWEDNCSACHAPFSPTGSHNGLHGVLRTGTASDALCQKCHQGPAHHAGREKPEDAASCASCHVDHKGRHALLSAVPDRSCTQCHASLGAHVTDGKPRYHDTITRFDRDHPQFRLGPTGKREELGKAKDPGRLRFNHKQHLTAGLKYDEKDARAWTIGDISDPVLRERYARAQPEGKRGVKDAVELSCASCHQLDPTDAPPVGPGQTAAARPGGAYFQSVTYDQHCKACHPLTFDPRLPGKAVPHHLQPDEVGQFLWGAYADAAFAPGKGAGKGTRPLPGWNLTREELAARKAKTGEQARQAEAELWVNDLTRARQYVFEGKAACGLCHEYERKDGKPTRVLPTDVPAVWYPHAKFSHRPHRGVTCESCHDGAKSSTTHADVLLPGVANCVACHAPATGAGEAKRGGVRSDCVTCHSYHHGDVPLAGRGADARGAAKRFDIGAFLRGGK